jgi:hypothetical protein
MTSKAIESASAWGIKIKKWDMNKIIGQHSETKRYNAGTKFTQS